MNGPESKPWRWPIRAPSDTHALARDASFSAAKRHARGELRGSSARSASKLRAGSDIEARLDELAPAVELVRVARGAVRPRHEGREALQRETVVGAHDGDRRRILALGADGDDAATIAVVSADNGLALERLAALMAAPHIAASDAHELYRLRELVETGLYVG